MVEVGEQGEEGEVGDFKSRMGIGIFGVDDGIMCCVFVW